LVGLAKKEHGKSLGREGYLLDGISWKPSLPVNKHQYFAKRKEVRNGKVTA
jgi:hypothetical protein